MQDKELQELIDKIREYAPNSDIELVEKAYQVSCQEGDYYKLAGVVSRKKQLIPAFMAGLQA